MDINGKPMVAGRDVTLPIDEARRLEARWGLDEAPLNGSTKHVE